MHAISSYHGNRPTSLARHRQGRLQYTAPQLSAQYNKTGREERRTQLQQKYVYLALNTQQVMTGTQDCLKDRTPPMPRPRVCCGQPTLKNNFSSPRRGRVVILAPQRQVIHSKMVHFVVALMRGATHRTASSSRQRGNQTDRETYSQTDRILVVVLYRPPGERQRAGGRLASERRVTHNSLMQCTGSCMGTAGDITTWYITANSQTRTLYHYHRWVGDGLSNTAIALALMSS